MDPCFPLSGSPPADLLVLIQFLESSPLDERSGYALDEYWGDLNRCPTLFPFLSFSPSLSPPSLSLPLSPSPPERTSKIQTKISVLVNDYIILMIRV